MRPLRPTGGRRNTAATRAGVWVAALVCLSACAPRALPIREPVKLDPGVPIGRIEAGRFTGVRIPVTLSTEGTDWEISTSYPKFMLEQGYEEEGLKQSDVFAFNPRTKASLQVSLSPAGRYATFSQEAMELLVSMAKGGIEDELDDEFGSGNYSVTHTPVLPIALKGVPYAARSYSIAESGSLMRINGWIYGFVEPFQIFLLYQIVDSGSVSLDRQAVEKIVSTFEYLDTR